MAFRTGTGRGVVFALAWLLAGRAGAQPVADPSQASRPGAAAVTVGYEALIKQALSEYDAHNYAEARALLTQAHGLNPNARTLRGLGMAEFELKNYGDSIQRLEAALSSTARPLSDELRRNTEELLARARTFVAHYELSLRPEPPRARVVVDGAPVQFAPGQPLTLTVGEHMLRVQAPGYQEEKRALSVKGGDVQRLAIELHLDTQPPGAPLLATSAAPATRDDRSLLSSPWLWTGVGVVVVVGGVVTAILLTRPHTEAKRPIAGDLGGVVQTLSWR